MTTTEETLLKGKIRVTFDLSANVNAAPYADRLASERSDDVVVDDHYIGPARDRDPRSVASFARLFKDLEIVTSTKALIYEKYQTASTWILKE